MAADPKAPLFSVLTPVYDPPVEILTQTLDSVLAQTFRDWELVLVDDCSPSPQVSRLLRDYESRDPRVRLVRRETNGHIVAASNDALAAARGTFVALLDHDDLLTRDALARNAAEIRLGREAGEEIDYLYSDEDFADVEGRCYDPFRKPDWSPERLRSQNYCGHLSVLRTSLVRQVGGFRSGFDGAQDHDLVLRVTEQARRIVHIPRVLYHWRAIEGSTAATIENKSFAGDAGLRAVQDHLDRVGVAGTVEPYAKGKHRGYRVRRALPPERRVSIVIPTIGSEGFIWGRRAPMVLTAVRTALQKSRHQNLEVVVVVDDPTPSSVIEQLRELAGERLRLVRFREKFNYSRKMNLGVLASTGDRLVLLNDDVEVISPNWLEEVLGPLEEPDVAMVGPKLRFSNGTLQHVGLAFTRGAYVHPFKGVPPGNGGPSGLMAVARETSGVTGACAGMRREVFLELGGFCEQLPGNFNDVDLCYKARAAGYRVVFTPHAELYHFESMTRVTKVHPWETGLLYRRWGRPERDPYLPEFDDMPKSRAERRESARRAHVRKLERLGMR